MNRLPTAMLAAYVVAACLALTSSAPAQRASAIHAQDARAVEWFDFKPIEIELTSTPEEWFERRTRQGPLAWTPGKERAHILVEVVDERGERVETDPRTVEAPYCTRLPERVRHGSLVDPPRNGTSIEPGLWSFEVEAGGRYAIGWIDAEHSLVERVVELDRGRPELWTRLQLGQVEEVGSVELRVLGEDGERFAPDDLEVLDISVHSSLTGKELWGANSIHVRTARGLPVPDRGCTMHRLKDTLTLPPGRYVIRATPILFPLLCGRYRKPIDHGSDEAEVVIQPGSTQPVTLRPWLGGRVRLSVGCPDRGPGNSNRETRTVLLEPKPGEGAWRVATIGANAPSLYIQDLSANAIAVAARLVDAPSASSSENGPYVFEGLVRPGLRRLRVSAPGFETVDLDVTVRARETLDVPLQRLERQE